MPSSAELEAFLTQPFNVQVAGIRKDGRPRAKYNIFRRDPRVELVIDDPAGHRYVGLSGTVEVREDVPANLHFVRAIRQKHGRIVPSDDELAAELTADERVLLAVTPSAPQTAWILWGFG